MELVVEFLEEVDYAYPVANVGAGPDAVVPHSRVDPYEAFLRDICSGRRRRQLVEKAAVYVREVKAV